MGGGSVGPDGLSTGTNSGGPGGVGNVAKLTMLVSESGFFPFGPAIICDTSPFSAP